MFFSSLTSYIGIATGNRPSNHFDLAPKLICCYTSLFVSPDPKKIDGNEEKKNLLDKMNEDFVIMIKLAKSLLLLIIAMVSQ